MENDNILNYSICMTFIKNINIIKEASDPNYLKNFMTKLIKLQKDVEDNKNHNNYKDLVDCIVSQCNKDLSISKLFMDFIKNYTKVNN